MRVWRLLVAVSAVSCGGLLELAGDDDDEPASSNAVAPGRDGGRTDDGPGTKRDAGIDATADARADATPTPCGNGVINAGETCDDGNASNGDGCNASCQPEPGWSCTGAPSTCETVCGDGIVAGSETCDDEVTCPGTCRRWLWSKRFGDTAGQQVTGLGVDPSGAAIMTGFYQGTIDFGGAPLAATGISDVFIAKLDGDGKHVWSRRAGGTGDDRAWSLAVDSDGNVVVVGFFGGTIGFGGTPLVSAGSWDVFVVKLDPAGNTLWSKRFGDAQQQEAHSVAIDASGNIVVAGMFWGAVDFGGGPLTSAGATDMFVVKLDSAGNHSWSKSFGNTVNQNATNVAVSASGDVYVTGTCAGAIDFGAGPVAAIGDSDAFLLSLDSTGGHRWSKRWGAGNAYQGGSSVAVDSSNDVVVAGYCQGSIDFGTGTLPGHGGLDVFVAKLDTSGTPIFTRRFGSSVNEAPSRISTDASKNILLTGYYEGPVDFGGGPIAHAGARNAFIAKLDASGNHLWSRGYGTWVTGIGVAAESTGHVFFAGYFREAIDFGTGVMKTAGGLYGSDDVFLAKLSP